MGLGVSEIQHVKREWAGKGSSVDDDRLLADKDGRICRVFEYVSA